MKAFVTCIPTQRAMSRAAALRTSGAASVSDGEPKYARAIDLADRRNGSVELRICFGAWFTSSGSVLLGDSLLMLLLRRRYDGV